MFTNDSAKYCNPKDCTGIRSTHNENLMSETQGPNQLDRCKGTNIAMQKITVCTMAEESTFFLNQV